MMSNYTQRSYSQRGVTLVELLVVLGGIGIVLALILPSIKSLGRGIILHAEAIQLAQDIRYTQQQSLTGGENLMLQLDIKENFYFIKPSSSSLSPTVKTVYLNSGINFKGCSFRRGAGANRYYIEFNSVTGIPGQTGSIELINQGGGYRKIVVEPSTGRVRIEAK